MDYYKYQFEAPLERYGVGKTKKIWYNVLFLDPNLQAKLPFDKYPRLRVEGEIADIPIENAFIPSGDGRNYVIVSPLVIKESGIGLGDIVEMRFRIADQDKVDIPDALEIAIENDSELQSKWDDITPGKKRMLCQHVLSAKTEKTRDKRIIESCEALRHYRADLRAWRNSKKN